MEAMMLRTSPLVSTKESHHLPAQSIRPSRRNGAGPVPGMTTSSPRTRHPIHTADTVQQGEASWLDGHNNRFHLTCHTTVAVNKTPLRRVHRAVLETKEVTSLDLLGSNNS